MWSNLAQAAQRKLTIEEQAAVMDTVLQSGQDVVLTRLLERMEAAGVMPPGVTVQYSDLSVQRWVGAPRHTHGRSNTQRSCPGAWQAMAARSTRRAPGWFMRDCRP
jgi:hypothetical protein